MDMDSEVDPEALLAYTGQVRRLARSLLQDRDLAEDVAQDAILAGLRSGPRDPGLLGAWLAAVVRNLGRRAVRSRGRRRERERGAARPEALPSASVLAARAEGYRRVVAAVLALAEPYRSTVLLRAIEERSVAEIAARQGLPAATVKTRLARARGQLRAQLGVDEGRAPAWLVGLTAIRRGGGGGASAGGSAAAYLGGIAMATKMKGLLVGLLVAALLAGTWWGRTSLAPTAPIDAPPGAVPAVVSAIDGAPTPATSEGAAGERRAVPAGPPKRDLRSTAMSEAAPQIKGLGVDEAGVPVAGARVEVRVNPASIFADFGVGDEGPPIVRDVCVADEEGRFLLEGERARAMDVHASADGYATSFIEEILAPVELRLVLRRPARLRGRVVRGEDGAGVRGGILRVYQPSGWSVHPLAEDGSFDVRDLIPGTIGFLAVPAHEATGRYQEVVLAPGEERELSLTAAIGIAISGRITDAVSGAPLADAEVSAWSFLWKGTRTDADGRYRIEGVGLDRAREIVARATGHGRSERRLDPRRPDGNDLALMPSRSARGRIVDAAGNPVEAAVVLATASGYEDGVLCVDKRVAVSNAQGDFELVDLRPDLPHYLGIHASGHADLVRSLGDGPSSPSVIELGRLPLAAAASLEGIVMDATMHPLSASIGLGLVHDVDPERRRLEGRRITAGADGRFAFSDLAPGRYSLGVWREDIPPFVAGEWELSEGEARTGLTIVLPWGLAIEGVVVGPDGSPLEGVHLVAYGQRQSGRTRVVGTSDRDGRFRFAGLDAGPHRVAASFEGTADLHGQTVHLAPTAIEGIEPGGPSLAITLRAEDATITGRVVDVEGRPVSLAYVWLSSRAEAPLDGVLANEAGRFTLRVARDETVSIAARRTEHLSAAPGNINYSEAVVRRRILPPEHGEGRVDDVIPGTEDLVLRLR